VARQESETGSGLNGSGYPSGHPQANRVSTSGGVKIQADLSSPPVIQVMFQSGLAPAEDVSADALSAGQGTEGNQFVFSGGNWSFNLQTKNHTASGTYTVTMVSGDGTEYIIDPTCTVKFVIP
jgi:hypothetical protein